MVPGSIPEGSYLDLGGSRERMPGSYPLIGNTADGIGDAGATPSGLPTDLELRNWAICVLICTVVVGGVLTAVVAQIW